MKGALVIDNTAQALVWGEFGWLLPRGLILKGW